jgi:hypothetical protein
MGVAPGPADAPRLQQIEDPIMPASTAHALPTAPVARITVDASQRIRGALLVCGILSSLVYAANNVICAVVWKGYSSFSQVISELSAIGAPSRSTWVPLGIAYAALLVAFGVGVWQSAAGKHGLRVTAALLISIGAVPYWPPMHMRGTVATLTDTLHIVFGGMTSLVILLAIGFAVTAFGKRFRLYSIATVVVLLASGSLTFLYAPRLAANLPTPGMGLIERIDLGAYLMWVVVLAIALLRRRSTQHA